MAGTTHASDAPYPTGDRSTVTVRLGSHLVTGKAATVLDTFVLPWDCRVLSVHRSYTSTHASEDLASITLKTVDSTALTIVASASPSADIVGAEQTLHSDIIGVTLVKGNKIQLKATSNASAEHGTVRDTLELLPVHG